MLLDLMNLGLIGASSLQREEGEGAGASTSGGKEDKTKPEDTVGSETKSEASPGDASTEDAATNSPSPSPNPQSNTPRTGKAHLGLLGLLSGTVLAAGCCTPTQVKGALAAVVSGAQSLIPSGGTVAGGAAQAASGAAHVASGVGHTLLGFGKYLWGGIKNSPWGQNMGAWGSAIKTSTVGAKAGAVLGVPVAAFKGLFGGCMAAGFAGIGAWTAAIPGFLGMGLLWAGYHKTIGKSISNIGAVKDENNPKKMTGKIKKDVTNLTFAGGNVFAALSILAAGACTPMALAWATPFIVGTVKRVRRISGKTSSQQQNQTL